jgi:hypothetical protein
MAATARIVYTTFLDNVGYKPVPFSGNRQLAGSPSIVDAEKQAQVALEEAHSTKVKPDYSFLGSIGSRSGRRSLFQYNSSVRNAANPM